MRSTCPIVVFFLVASLLAAEETNRLTQTGTDTIHRLMKAGRPRQPLVLADDDRQLPVLVMEPLKSDAVAKLFPQHECYRLIASRDVIHGAHSSVLLINTNSSPSHLQSDQQVADFLGDPSRKVKTEADAKLMTQAFADLRSYRIVEERPTTTDPRKPGEIPAPLPTDFKVIVEEGEREWRVYATLFTCDYSSSISRYVFTIYKHPGSGLDFDKPVLIHLGNYVY